jgi:hypothetical protein
MPLRQSNPESSGVVDFHGCNSPIRNQSSPNNDRGILGMTMHEKGKKLYMILDRYV